MNSEEGEKIKSMRVIAVLALLVGVLGLLPTLDGGGFSVVNTIYFGVAISQIVIALLLFFKPSLLCYILCSFTSSYFIFFEVFYNIFSLSSVISIFVLASILVWLSRYIYFLRQGSRK